GQGGPHRAAWHRRGGYHGRGFLSGGPRRRLPGPRRADHGARGPVRDQDLGRGRAEDPDRRPGRRLRHFAPVAADSDLAQLIDALPPELAEHVFTHTSWASERSESYERLEFLGDSVLELAVAHALYTRHPDFSEGKLAKARPHPVFAASGEVGGGAPHATL